MRTKRSLATAELAVLESIGHSLGLLSGPRTRGRTPKKIAEVLPKIQDAMDMILLNKFKARD